MAVDDSPFRLVNDFLRLVVTNLPLLLMYVVGMVLAILTWRRHPRISLTALLAFALLLVAFLGTSFLSSLVIFQANQRQGVTIYGRDPPRLEELQSLLVGVHFLGSLIAAGAYALLFAAIFGWRGPRSEQMWFSN